MTKSALLSRTLFLLFLSLMVYLGFRFLLPLFFPPQTVEIAKIPIPLWIADAVLCGKLHHHRPAPLEDSGTVEATILQFPHIPPDFGTNLRIPGIYHMPLH